MICVKEKRDEIEKGAIDGGTSAGSAAEDDGVIRGSRGSVKSRSYGKISAVGRRREMEDVVAVESGFLKRGEESYDFFGVYEGHGGGWRVAHACGQMLHKMFAKIVEEENTKDRDSWEGVMAAGFNMVNAEVNKEDLAVATMGCTVMELAVARGSRDNISIIVVKI